MLKVILIWGILRGVGGILIYKIDWWINVIIKFNFEWFLRLKYDFY